MPGGGWSNRADAGAWQQAQERLLARRLIEARGPDTVVASVCTGGMLLAEAGLLDGRAAVTHSSTRARRAEILGG